MITLTGTPTLHTERLTLRAPQPRDAAAFIDYFGTERSQYTGGPKTERHAWDYFCTEIGHWVMHGFGMFTVTFKDDDTALGIVGHWYPHTRPETEIGWLLFEAAHEGKGIAHEAATACIHHAWDVLQWDSMVSYIAHGNDASVALAKRLGATLDETAAQPKPHAPCYVYRHTKVAA